MKRHRTILLAAVVAGVVLRVFALDRLPGINADEAWYGVNVEAFLNNEPPFVRTGVGNPLNPLHSLPLLALSYVAAPSMALLRVPSVIWGVAAVLLAFPLLVRPLGQRAAVLAALLLSILPAAVAYSRLGWDPSDTPVVALIAVGCALGDRPLTAAIALLVAMAVHPTNVFLAPIVALSWAPFALARYGNAIKRQRRILQVIATAVLVVLVLAGFILRDSIGHGTSLPSMAVVIRRLVSPGAWLDLIQGVIGLFSGVTIARYIGGPVPDVAVLLASLVTLMAFAVPIAVAWNIFAGNGGKGPWLLAGITVGLVAFHAVAGPEGLQPGRERYGMFLLSPLVILCAIGLAAFAERAPRASFALTALVFSTLLAVLVGGYFAPLLRRGGDTHQAYRTGHVEPKVAAYQFIKHIAGADNVEVIAEDWWLYWPLKYLSSRDERVFVTIMPDAAVPGGLRPAGATAPVPPLTPHPRFAVVFDGGSAWSRRRSEDTAVFSALDPIGRPILHVLELADER